MVEKYKVITLCGSTRFKDAFLEAQKCLTLEGNIVISVGLFGHSGDAEVWEGMDEGARTATKEMLDDMHRRKIDMADEIYVINVGGYIGESTRGEIEYAKQTGKIVKYLEPVTENELTEEDILDDIVIIKVNRSYHVGMTAEELYDITRGCWKRRIESVEKAEYALAVVSGTVVEVYRVLRWDDAARMPRKTIPYNAKADEGRITFEGMVAPAEVRARYLNMSVKRLYKRGEADPVKVILGKGKHAERLL